MTRVARGAVAVTVGCATAVALLVTVGVTTGATPSRDGVVRPHRAEGTPSSSSSSSASASSLASNAAVPATGTVTTRTIPGTTSHFVARPALIWTPPAVRTDPGLRLPVLELLIGTSSAPEDWLTRGGLEQRLTADSAAHDGRAPIVVVVDENGQRHADTECVSTSTGDVERYLAVDVPHWIETHLPVAAGRADRAVGGLSEGGTCALMLALRHPAVWGTFDDISGLARPTVGRDDDRARTVAGLFGGDTAAFDAHDPTVLLSRHRYRSTSGELYFGTGDAMIVRDVAVLRPLLARAGLPARIRSTAGGHSWPVFGAGLSSFLSWWDPGR